MTQSMNPEELNSIAKMIAKAESVVAITGAGVSAESGVPTFRDAQEGLWAKYDPMELATPGAFARDPELVTRWYDERRCRLQSCEPNPGHLALVKLAERVRERGGRFTLITQNVDRLHQAAGSDDVIELHGSIWDWRCTSCGMVQEERGGPFSEFPPRCDSCGAARRPGVVWFGESLSEDAMDRADEAVSVCDLFLSIGTSAVVHPAAGFAYSARMNGARVVEINLEPTPLSGLVDVSVQAPSGEALPRILDLALAIS